MNTQATVPISKIYSEPNTQDTTVSKIDPSFDDTLKTEQLKLEQKQKLFSALPWKALQNLFHSLPLEFNFEFSPASIENHLMRPNQSINLYKPEEGNTHGSKALIENGNGAKVSASPSPGKLSYTIDQNAFVQNLLAESKYAIAEMWIPFNLYGIQNIKGKALDLEVVVSEIVDKVKLVKEGEKVTLSLALKPEETGELLLNLSMKNGIISILILANQETKDWIEANMEALEESLRKANINLGNLEVSAGKNSSNAFISSDESLEFLSLNLSEPKREEVLSKHYEMIEPYTYEKLFGLVPKQYIYSRV